MTLFSLLNFIINHPVNRDNKIRSIIRFAKWQFGSRLVPGAVVYNWINDSRFIVRNGEAGLTCNIYTGLHEFNDMAFLLHLLNEEDLFIDVGANVGSYTILACAAAGARGIAFEPVPTTYQRLMDNMRINALERRVQCLNIGVGKEEGQINFTADMDTTNHALAEGEHSDKMISVKVSTLDQVLRNESPVLMKIDVEGFETLVIQGATDTLKNPELLAVIMELNGCGSRYGFNESEILKIMIANGFNTYSYNPFERSLVSLDGKNQSSGNTLFIRDMVKVKERLKNARNIKVHGKEF